MSTSLPALKKIKPLLSILVLMPFLKGNVYGYSNIIFQNFIMPVLVLRKEVIENLLN